MRIDLLCSNKNHPIYPRLSEWVSKQKKHESQLVSSKDDLIGGDVLFLISCTEIINHEIRDLYSNVLVIHASDLPKGRGWSPHIWSIVSGENTVVVSVIEALDAVDTGKIWMQETIEFEGHELYQEINQKLFDAEIILINKVIEQYFSIEPVEQNTSIEPSYLRKRTPEDSVIDISKTIEEQFNLLRVCDNERYPAYFEHLGVKYLIKIEKAELNE